MRALGLPIIAFVALLGGCAPALEVSSITEIKSVTGSRGIDVHEPRRLQGNQSAPEFAGDQLLEVRTYVNKDEAGQVEIPGANCTLSAADFNATMVTPAKVRVPLYRGQSSQLAVNCELDGYKKRMVTVAAVDVTRQQRYATGGSGGLIGVVAVAAVDALSDNSKNEWRYPLARVVLEPEPKSKAVAARQ